MGYFQGVYRLALKFGRNVIAGATLAINALIDDAEIALTDDSGIQLLDDS